MIGEAIEDGDDNRIVADAGQDRCQGCFQGIILDADENHVLYACRSRIIGDSRVGDVVAEEVAVYDEALCLERFFALFPGNECHVIIIGTEDGRDISPDAANASNHNFHLHGAVETRDFSHERSRTSPPFNNKY